MHTCPPTSLLQPSSYCFCFQMKPEACLYMKKMTENSFNQCHEVTTHKDQCTLGISEVVRSQSKWEKSMEVIKSLGAPKSHQHRLVGTEWKTSSVSNIYKAPRSLRKAFSIRWLYTPHWWAPFQSKGARTVRRAGLFPPNQEDQRQSLDERHCHLASH